jgi:hypothetical protein
MLAVVMVLADWTKALDAVRLLTPRLSAAVALAAAGALFAPSAFLRIMRLERAVERHGEAVGIAFLSASAFLLVHLALWLRRGIREWRVDRKRKADRRRRLSMLSADEKALLRALVARNARGAMLQLRDPVVCSLERSGILAKSSVIGDYDGWTYAIVDWAWEALNADPSQLE